MALVLAFLSDCSMQRKSRFLDRAFWRDPRQKCSLGMTKFSIMFVQAILLAGEGVGLRDDAKPKRT
jgi:hypothetical protein